MIFQLDQRMCSKGFRTFGNRYRLNITNNYKLTYIYNVSTLLMHYKSLIQLIHLPDTFVKWLSEVSDAIWLCMNICWLSMAIDVKMWIKNNVLEYIVQFRIITSADVFFIKIIKCLQHNFSGSPLYPSGHAQKASPVPKKTLQIALVPLHCFSAQGSRS